MSELIEAVLRYAAQGYRVHPCDPATKRPLTRWGSEATTEAWQIVQWWNHNPRALIGLCTGDGLVVVDVDPRNGGELDEDDLETATVITRSGGWHHYYWTSEPVGNAVGLLPGVDIRGAGGYVIAPPSPGWRWVDEYVPMRELPRIVIDKMSYRNSPRGYGNQASFEQRARVDAGGRNDYIARYTGYAIRMGLEDEAELLSTVRGHNDEVCVPPLDYAEVGRTVRSILARHRRGA